METFIPGFIMSLREGLEAFLIIVILLKFLDKTANVALKKNVWQGAFLGVAGSFIFGVILMWLSGLIGGTDTVAKLWESVASFVAVLLITTFIIWMISHSGKIRDHIENKATLNLSKVGIMLLALFMVAREGAEIAIFTFAGKYEVLAIVTGITLSAILALLIYHSLLKIKLQTIFKITLGYLILQAGFLLGYSLHEGLSAAKTLNLVDGGSWVFTKAFDLSKTILDNKTGALGLPLYIAFGWYSKPEWVQFITQYGYTFALFFYWYKKKSS